ncbi:TadE/TadG family type IV pilus assembly protein [Streptomyces mangrovisoli]|uniref:Septum formation initiator n=1 Tax=Streptomyces mangrovisoli TaxID=1428628 RepID=A0A1J4NUH8_9ACTN|nr:TadE/TadG family type IV pilus assembly protein [Streptomyces mangrovisoli]OIJ65172.1 septum formation initiator [Streptomyces mangrovisoli]
MGFLRRLREPLAPGRAHRDRGQVAIEYLGFVPILLLVALAGIQLGAVAYAAQQAGTAARAGARAASLGQDAQQACAAAVSSTMQVTCAAGAGADTVTVTATVHIPTVVWNLGDARRTATMPRDH